MKHLLFISAMMLFVISCKKEKIQDATNNPPIKNIMLQLKDSLSSNDFQQLDFNNFVRTNIPNKGQAFLRIAFKNKNLASDFILLKLINNDQFSSGKIFNIKKNEQPLSSKPATVFNGNIRIYSLSRTLQISSLITSGFIEAFHKNASTINGRADEVIILPLMPDVTIICSPSGGGGSGWNYDDYYNLMNFNGGTDNYEGGSFDGGLNSDPGNTGSYYSNSNPRSGSGSGNPPSSNVNNNPPSDDNPIYIDYESDDLPPINVNQYVKCFSSIPDAGATCTIKILTDIPVDNDPNKFFDWSLGSPGHTFLQLTKTNGAISVQQNIGFYPAKGWKTIITSAPIAGKLVDNAGHEFNASLSMDLDVDKFKSTLIHIQYLSNFIKYDMANYNCTDFALEVFNYRRGGGNQLTIPMYDIPGSMAPNGTATPEGLYQKLQQMQSNNSVDAPNITIPGVKGYAGASNGPCN